MAKDSQPTSEVKAKRTAKDSVFIDLFRDKKNLLKLYKALHPEDASATEDDLDIVTIENVLTDSLYNDLGFMAHGDRLLVLVEAQSTWSENILVRCFLYLAQTYLEYFLKTGQKLHGRKKVQMPRPEIYVIFTGPKGNKPETLRLSEEFFDGAKTHIEIEATVLYEGRGKDIINEYIHFCGVFNEQTRRLGMTREAVEETIRICKDKDYLREYLSSKEKEVSTIMMNLFDQQRVMEEYAEERAEEAAEKAAKEAAEKAKSDLARATAEKLIRKGQMSLEDIADCVPSLTLDELREIEAGAMQLIR